MLLLDSLQSFQALVDYQLALPYPDTTGSQQIPAQNDLGNLCKEHSGLSLEGLHFTFIFDVLR